MSTPPPRRDSVHPEHDEHDAKLDAEGTVELSKRKIPNRIRQALRAPREEAAAYVGMVRIALQQLTRSRVARTGAIVVCMLALVAVFADLFASELPILCRFRGTTYVLPCVTHPAELAGLDNESMAAEGGEGDWMLRPVIAFGPNQTTTSGEVVALASPSLGGPHVLGTDTRGRDVAARLIHGTRTTLNVGLTAAVAFAVIGIFIGALAAFFGGLLDAVISRVIEALTAFPTFVLVLVVQALLSKPSMATLLFAIGLTRWTEVARLVRAEVLRIATQDYVQAARALGAGPWRVLRRHVMPNAVAPALVAAAFGIPSVVLVEASLDFLGIGLPDDLPSWGQILSEARSEPTAWWLVAFPGALVFGTVVAFNLVGTALRDALDPRLRDAVRVVEAAQEGRASLVPPSARAIDDSAHT